MHLMRVELLEFFEKQPLCLVGIEACCSLPLLGVRDRSPRPRGSAIPPAYVKPFVKRSKPYAGDAEANSGAVTRKTI
jgi:transposase